MPCRQVSTFNGTAASSGSYRTEAECNQACQEGACCEGAVCTVKPQCQCQGTGQVFRGVGTVCTPNPCGCCGNGETIAGKTATVAVSTDQMPTARWCAGGNGFVGCPNGQTYNGCWVQKPCETPDFGTWVDTAASLNATFTSNASGSSCTASLQGACPGYAGTRTASVGFSSSPCKIYATVDCPSLIAATVSGSPVSPYWAWTYATQTTTYTALYYVFQYIDGTGANTVTQSANSTPVIPSIPTGSSASWFLSKTVTVNMSLTLA
jgi:hypothetical protein